MFGQYTEGEVKVMKNIHEYIINSKPEKDVGDMMWVKNCYNDSMYKRSKEPLYKTIHSDKHSSH